MRMNRFILLFAAWSAILVPVHLFAHTSLMQYHMPQNSDSLQAYKLPYIAVTDSGQNCVWDFSVLLTDSAEVIDVDYFAPSKSDTSYIGCHREHTNYYYRYSKDTLWQTGYETSHTYVRYSSPIPLLRFPLTYGDSLYGQFAGKGQYCHMTPLEVEGSVSVLADAFGCLILPEDTFDNVLRVHTHMQYRETKHMQSLCHEERYAWYSPCCRYPLLENVTLRSIRGADTVLFSATYYYPQEKEDVPARQQLLPEDTISVAEDSLISRVTYLPNPVHNDLQVRYTLSRHASVYISVHYNGGTTTYQTPIRQEDEGEHLVSVNMAGLPIGAYVVYVHADDAIVSGNIIKL